MVPAQIWQELVCRRYKSRICHTKNKTADTAISPWIKVGSLLELMGGGKKKRERQTETEESDRQRQKETGKLYFRRIVVFVRSKPV